MGIVCLIGIVQIEGENGIGNGADFIEIDEAGFIIVIIKVSIRKEGKVFESYCKER